MLGSVSSLIAMTKKGKPRMQLLATGNSSGDSGGVKGGDGSGGGGGGGRGRWGGGGNEITKCWDCSVNPGLQRQGSSAVDT